MQKNLCVQTRLLFKDFRDVLYILVRLKYILVCIHTNPTLNFFLHVGLNPEMKTYSNIMMRAEKSAIEFIESERPELKDHFTRNIGYVSWAT